MITIAFVSTTLNPGGAEQQWLNLIRGINKEKFRIVLICLYDLGTVGNTIKNSGIVAYSKIFKNRYSAWSVIKLIRIMQSEKVSAIFMMHWPLLIGYVTVAAKYLGLTKIVTAVHSTDYIDRKYRSYMLDRVVFKNISSTIALSEQHKRYLSNVLKYPENKLLVISNGVNMSKFCISVDKDAFRRGPGIEGNRKVVGIIGRLDPVKRHDIFIDAAYSVCSNNKNVVFLIIGDGPERTNIEKKIESLGMTDNIKLLGHRTDVPELLNVIDLSVLSSDTEALPMAIIEAMAAGLPIVATNVGSLSDLVEDGMNGYLVPPDSSEALARAILKIVDNDSTALRMGQISAAQVRERFTEEIMLDKYEKLFSAI